jgi:DNA invertase Pin-like site-specific DNA recombinase
MFAKRFTAIYVRVSTSQQSTRSQIPDLKRWAQSQDGIGPVKWFEDKATGRTMDRPAWNRLQEDIEENRVKALVVWRLDRLGRTASGLTKLFEELRELRIQFVSIKDSIDLNTTAGRLIANVLASVASYETEVRGERVLAGQAAARANGKSWGGSQKGRLHIYTKEQAAMVYNLKQTGKRVSTISKATGVDRQSIYRMLKRIEEGLIKV